MATGLPVLLVDDSPDDVDLCVRALKKAGLVNDVVIARDGVEALQQLGIDGASAAAPALPAVVLLDIHMPRMDGFETLTRIRAHERTKTLPVVVLTSSREGPDVARAYALGANSFVQKPVDFGRFSEAVTKLGVYWLMVNHSPGKGPAG
jgi:two-component system response regulator